MEDSLLSDEKLKKLYQTLQKSVSQIKKDSPKIKIHFESFKMEELTNC